jgi:glutamate-5-semialdehyde dehydrogenase
VSISAQAEAAFRSLREASRTLRQLPAEKKNEALNALAHALVAGESELLEANARDLAALDAGATPAFRDRLTLSPARIGQMAESLRQVAALPDPVGELVEERTLANGLRVRRVRAPLGVIFMIFESRPNVICEAFSLAFKSGNAIALRGGSDSRHTAARLYSLMRHTLAKCKVGEHSFLGIDDYDRALVTSLLQRNDLIDVAVPRGGDKLIDLVSRTATMAVIKNDRGLCHGFVDESADLPSAVKVIRNAKTQRPGVCNALETVLVHEKIAKEFLPLLHEACAAQNLEWRCDEASALILQGKGRVKSATEEDWDTEHLDLILNCRVVENLEEALRHIERHGSRHSETILTRNEPRARRFQAEVDAAAVYWNASTRFTDGFELGLGGELGISTQKLHVRGPVGLRELTTPRWIIDGEGQIRR